MVIEGTQRHDMKLGRSTTMLSMVERPEQPQGICLDKGYGQALSAYPNNPYLHPPHA